MVVRPDGIFVQYSWKCQFDPAFRSGINKKFIICVAGAASSWVLAYANEWNRIQKIALMTGVALGIARLGLSLDPRPEWLVQAVLESLPNITDVMPRTALARVEAYFANHVDDPRADIAVGLARAIHRQDRYPLDADTLVLYTRPAEMSWSCTLDGLRNRDELRRFNQRPSITFRIITGVRTKPTVWRSLWPADRLDALNGAIPEQ